LAGLRQVYVVCVLLQARPDAGIFGHPAW
jgi:hypothetical protein